MLFAVLFVVNWLVSSALLAPPDRTEIPYTLFRAQVEAGNVPEITSIEDRIEGALKKEVTYPPGEDGVKVSRFRTYRPSFAADDDLFTQLTDKGVVVSARPPPGPSFFERLLVGFGPTLLFLGLFLLISRRGAGGLGAGGIGGIGRSKAQRVEPGAGPRVTFADVAGIDDVEEEVAEIVDFLRNPDRYRRLGAAAPKGVLLSGPPGTGKTLLARALAGEAHVPFYSASASEFIEMIVGVGASRVRDLFEQAKKDAPAIIFIDELDAIGRARGGATSVGGHDEREQTLNQILTEMDGFTGNEGVIVLGATNRPEILDPALLRPGRFDRRLTISPPDQAGRRAILDVHIRGVPLADDVDLDAVASSTPGMVGAELKNLINEAAILAARRGRDRVQASDFNDALEKIVLGTARRIVMSPEDRRRTAYHEGGHALLGMLTPGADPVRKISIIPRGHALGVTFQSPDEDRYGYSESYLGADRRGAGRPGGRGARLRRGDHRRRERPGAGHPGRPPDGRPVGNVRRPRARLDPPGAGGAADVRLRRQPARPRHPRAPRRRDPPAPRGGRRNGPPDTGRTPFQPRQPRRGAAGGRDPRRRRGLPRRRDPPGRARRDTPGRVGHAEGEFGRRRCYPHRDGLSPPGAARAGEAQ